jgi:UDP-N-acetylmuramoyl-tripeptide--D-alanyl-D-alanine ligase
MEPVSLHHLSEVVDATAPSAHRALVLTGVSTDTRSVAAGDVFFALRGERFDGAAFLDQAFERGAVAAVVHKGAPEQPAGRPVLRVDDVRAALGAFAAQQRESLGVPVLAITGSAGKTTTKDMAHAALSSLGPVVKAPGSFNNDVGVPLTLLMADRQTRAIVVEVGTNAPGEIAALAKIAQPDVAIITCIGEAHLEGLGSIEGVAREKLSLLQHLRPGGTAILNGDDLRLRGAASALASARGPEGVVLCGLDAGQDWRGEVRSRGVTWTIATTHRAPTGSPRPGPALELKVPGHHIARDALLALAAAARLGVDPAQAASALADYQPSRGRWGVHQIGATVLVDDTYNANPTSVQASLEAFASVAPPARRAVVLGGMHELGEASEAAHRAIGRCVARMGVAHLVTVGELARGIAAGAVAAGLPARRVQEVDDALEVPACLSTALLDGDAVLFKASRACRLERAVELILEDLTATRPEARPAAA